MTSKYFWSLFFVPDYKLDPEYVDASVATDDLGLSQLESVEAQETILDFAYRSYTEQRDLFFRLEVKRDDFLKFCIAIFGVTAAAITAGKVAINCWLLSSAACVLLAIMVLLLSRRSTAFPQLPDINEIRRAYQQHNLGKDWLAGAIMLPTAALNVLSKHRARHLDFSIWLLALAMCLLFGWLITFLTVAPVSTP